MLRGNTNCCYLHCFAILSPCVRVIVNTGTETQRTKLQPKNVFRCLMYSALTFTNVCVAINSMDTHSLLFNVNEAIVIRNKISCFHITEPGLCRLLINKPNVCVNKEHRTTFF